MSSPPARLGGVNSSLPQPHPSRRGRLFLGVTLEAFGGSSGRSVRVKATGVVLRRRARGWASNFPGKEQERALRVPA
jgi:hypothetical protein